MGDLKPAMEHWHTLTLRTDGVLHGSATEILLDGKPLEGVVAISIEGDAEGESEFFDVRLRLRAALDIEIAGQRLWDGSVNLRLAPHTAEPEGPSSPNSDDEPVC